MFLFYFLSLFSSYFSLSFNCYVSFILSFLFSFHRSFSRCIFIVTNLLEYPEQQQHRLMDSNTLISFPVESGTRGRALDDDVITEQGGGLLGAVPGLRTGHRHASPTQRAAELWRALLAHLRPLVAQRVADGARRLLHHQRRPVHHLPLQPLRVAPPVPRRAGHLPRGRVLHMHERLLVYDEHLDVAR